MGDPYYFSSFPIFVLVAFCSINSAADLLNSDKYKSIEWICKKN